MNERLSGDKKGGGGEVEVKEPESKQAASGGHA
jgi:hypothetical protein